MKDYYHISLEILYQLLKEVGEEHWANWIQKDIHLWTTTQSVDHHLAAYGGMGSINDLSVGGLDTIDIWKNNLFEMAKTLAWSLAKRKITTAPLEEEFYRYGASEIGGWRCRNCGLSRIGTTNVELYLAAEFLPKLFVAYIKQDKLLEILDLENIIVLDSIVEKRNAIEKLVQNSNITLSIGNNWLQTCPDCNSEDVCAYRWQITDNYTKLTEAKNN